MIIFDERKHQKDLIAEGGEGKIYLYGQNQVIKVYKGNVNKIDKLEKLKVIMSKNLPGNVVKPIKLIYNPKKQFIGFSMKRIIGEELRMLASKKFVISNNIKKDKLMYMLIQIKETLKSLHGISVYIGDLNDMNILFDENYRVYFIDIDSWSVDDLHKCTVANDSFKDPKLMSNNFNSGTDNYSFAIIVYKALTRLHPFGGVIKSSPNLNLVDRMERQMPVIDINDIIIPRMTDKHVFMSSNLLNDLLDIYAKDSRKLIDSNLEDFKANLAFCDNHQDYYYANFNECPVCVSSAEELVPIVRIGIIKGIPFRKLFSNPKIKIILNENLYLDNQNNVVCINSQDKVPFERGVLYHANVRGDVLYKIRRNLIEVQSRQKVFQIIKQYNSSEVIQDNDLFYISKGLNLTRFSLIDANSTAETSIAKVSINNVFHVHDLENYFICNSFNNMKIIDISGYNHQLDNSDKIVEYGIHYDEITAKWLFITKNQKGEYSTYIFEKNKGVIYNNNKIHYMGKLSNLCFNNDIIFKPADKKIIGFNYQKNEYKEFDVPIITEESALARRKQKFIAINLKEIYEIG